MAAGEYWPEGQRFGVMVVSGYSDSALAYDKSSRGHATHSFVFHVIDLHRQAEVVAVHVGRGDTLEEHRVQLARERAVRSVDRWNAAEQRALAVCWH